MDAATEEGAFKGILAMHTAATETGDLACGIEARQHRSISAQAPPGKIGLDAAEGLAGQDVQLDGDKRPLRLVK